MRARWWAVALVAIILLPAAVLLLLDRASGPGGIGRVATKPVLVGSVVVQVTPSTVGSVVAAQVTLRADRPVVVDGVRVELRDADGKPTDLAGRPYSLPDTGRVTVGPRPQRLTSAQVVHTVGVFSYVLQYRSGSTWVTLPPYDAITVG